MLRKARKGTGNKVVILFAEEVSTNVLILYPGSTDLILIIDYLVIGFSLFLLLLQNIEKGYMLCV